MLSTTDNEAYLNYDHIVPSANSNRLDFLVLVRELGV